MITQEDLKTALGAVIIESDEETYVGYPQLGTTSLNDPTWSIQQVLRKDGTITYKWSGGSLDKRFKMSEYKNIPYQFLIR